MDLSISLSNYPSSNHYTSSCVTTTNDIVSPLSNTNHDPTTGQSIQYLELLPHGPCYNNQTTHYAPNDLSDNDYTPSQLVPNITNDALKLGNLMTAKNHELIYSKSPVESRRSSNPNTPTTTNACKNWSMNISSSCYSIDVNEVPIITKIASNVSSQTCNYNYRNYNSANSSAEMIDGNSNSTIKCKSNDSANSGSIKKRRLAGDQTNHEDYGHGDEEIYDDQEGISEHDDEEIYNANYALDQGAGNYCSMNSNSGGAAGRKKLRLSKQQSTLLEESFRRQSTLNPKQKNGLAKQLDLSPRQVEVWFQNRRARTKLKQTEADCELLKRCCESLTAENRRLRAEVAELRAMSLHTPPPALPAPPVASYNPHVAAEHPSRDGGGGGVIVDAIPNHPNRRRHRLTAPISSDHHDHTTTTTTTTTTTINNTSRNDNDNHNDNHNNDHNHNHDHNHIYDHNHNHNHDHNHMIMYSSVPHSSAAAAIPGARISHLFPATLPDQQLLLLFQPPPPPAPSCASTTSAA